MMLEAERAVQFCVSVAQRAQQALLRIDSGEASCSGADPVSRRPSRPLAYAPYASVGLAGHRARNCVQDLSVDDGEIHMRATQPGRPGNLSTAAWGRNPLLLDEGAEISDADEGTDGMTEEDRKKYEEEKLLVHRIEFSGADRELTRLAEEAIAVKQNFRHSADEVQDAIQAVYNLGFFEQVAIDPEETRDGFVLSFRLTPLPPFKGYTIKGRNVLPADVVADVLDDQVGRTSNFTRYNQAVQKIDDWYKQHGVLGAVDQEDIESRQLSQETGEFVFKVNEVKIGSFILKYVDQNGDPTAKHSTKDDVVMRYVKTKPGAVWDQRKLSEDVKRCFATGLFDDVSMEPLDLLREQVRDAANPDEPIVNLSIRLMEKEKMSHVTGGIGFSTEGQLPVPIGAISYSHINLFGRAQKLSASLQVNQTERSFNFEYCDPWMNSGPRQVSQVLSLVNDRKDAQGTFGRIPGEVVPESTEPDNTTAIAVQRMRGAIERSMPLTDKVTGTAGVSLTQCQCVGADGKVLLQDPYKWPMTRGAAGRDHIAKLTATTTYSDRASLTAALSLEQAVADPRRAPESGWLSFLRATGSACKEVPLGGGAVLRVAGSAAAHYGDCPPYEARPLGGVNCVRGWAEGAVGTARHWASGTVEAQYPLVPSVLGVAFVDGGSDLNSGTKVSFDPAGARGKPGQAFGYGAGIRVASPLGPIRLEYAWTDGAAWLVEGGAMVPRGRFHLGIGARF